MEPVDLLVFGPHPDDIEIGLGGSVARHAALGYSVGLCDLTAGEMGSNGTVEERLAEAEAARAVLGASWRVNLRLPDRAIGSDASHLRAVASLVRRARPRAVAIPYGADRHPDHVAASRLLVEGIFNAGLRRYDAEGDAWRPGWTCFYFINDSAPPSFVIDVSEYDDHKRRALACHVTQFQAASDGRGPDAAHDAALPAARRESGRAVRRPGGGPVRRGYSRTGPGRARDALQRGGEPGRQENVIL